MIDAVKDGVRKHVPPLGSIVLDVALVVYMAYTAGQMTNAVASLGERMTRLEMIAPDREIAVLKNQVAGNTALALSVQQAQMRDREELLARFDRLESKIDSLRR